METVSPRRTKRMLARQAIAVPGAAAAHGDLDPHGRFQQVQIGAVEQADFDESHSRRSI